MRLAILFAGLLLASGCAVYPVPGGPVYDSPVPYYEVAYPVAPAPAYWGAAYFGWYDDCDDHHGGGHGHHGGGYGHGGGGHGRYRGHR